MPANLPPYYTYEGEEQDLAPLHNPFFYANAHPYLSLLAVLVVGLAWYYFLQRFHEPD